MCKGSLQLYHVLKVRILYWSEPYVKCHYLRGTFQTLKTGPLSVLGSFAELSQSAPAAALIHS